MTITRVIKMQLQTKILIISALFAVKLVATACDFGTDSESSYSSSSSGSSGGTALPYGGGTYSWTCPAPSNTRGSTTIPPTSSTSCVTVYQNYAFVFGCNQIDDFSSAQSQYNSCLTQDSIACASASSSDPNC